MLISLDIDKLNNLPERNEWDILPTLTKLLKEISDSVNFCEREDSCISEQIPSVKCSMKTLVNTDYFGVNSLKEELIRNLQKYFYGGDSRELFRNIKENEHYSMASLLDPRFKQKAFFSKRAADQAELTLVEAVCNEIKKLQRRRNVAEDATPDSSKQRKVDSASRFATAHYASLEESSSCSEDDGPELQEPSCYNAAKALVVAYLSEPRCKVDDPP